MKALALSFLILVGAVAQSGAAQRSKLPTHDGSMVKRPDVFLSILPLARLDDWSPLVKPKHFDATAQVLIQAVENGRWAEATMLARKVRQMIPAETPAEYPWSYDTRAQWDVAIGELLAIQGRYDEADRAYAKVLAETREELQSSSRAQAASGRADIQTVRFRFQAAKAFREQASREYWSGCGNCSESQGMWAYIRDVVGKAANMPPAAAVDRLQKLVLGDFEPYVTQLTPTADDYQRGVVKVLASFSLGLFHSRLGREAEARQAFELCVATNNAHSIKMIEALWAWEHLQKMKNRNLAKRK
jgi:tetratricopeptide (TPR) repeat protein